MKALLIGGTGPTGPHIANGLVDRGYELTLFHRGVHEAPGLPECEHIHADPHFRETIDEALKGREFDVVIATYGRIRHIAAALAGRCRQFISVGGTPSHLHQLAPWKLHPFGGCLPIREGDGLAIHEAGDDEPEARFSNLVFRTEAAVMALHGQGFDATHFRYPRIYGPRQLAPPEWCMVRRILDGRKHMILAESGLEILSRLAAQNAAHFLLLAVDHAEAAAGQVFDTGDDRQQTWRQILEEVADILGSDIRMYSLPDRLAAPARSLSILQKVSSHCLLDTSKAKRLLGYSDVIDSRTALEQTVRWLIDNPITDFPQDRFDYEAEDRLIAAYEDAMAKVERKAHFAPPESVHLYPHPKKPTEGVDHRGR